jgi:prophage regulatory protein
MAKAEIEITGKGRRFLRLREVMQETGKTRSGIYEGMSDGTFPRSFQIGARAVAWFENDIENWKRTRLQAAGKVAA